MISAANPGRACPGPRIALSWLLAFRESFLVIAATLRLLQTVRGLQHGTGGGKHKPLSFYLLPVKILRVFVCPNSRVCTLTSDVWSQQRFASIIAESE